MIALMTLWHYWRSKRLRFADRAALEAYQQLQLQRFAQRVLAKSPYFSAYAQQPFSSWPLMNKSLMMTHFDQMNTAGLQRDALLACAQQSEQQRDFSHKLGNFSVGLSSGTSGQRGLFVVSPQEQQIWAGGMLAKMLPEGLLAGERVALFLRADNHLYHSVDNRWLSLAFYDLFAPFEPQLAQLQTWQPSIIVAPAQVLRALALACQQGKLAIKPKKVISVAEVLEPQDRQLLQQVFAEVGEVYQATEGFLAASCEQGSLHLNEEFLHIEAEWLDEQRFVPIITDFTRRTQPIVRYRLDDVLVLRSTPCPCGRVTRAISHIEGRNDDQLQLPNQQGQLQVVFADLCSRVIANALPLTSDYRLLQVGPEQLHLISDCSPEQLVFCHEQLQACFAQQGIAVSQLQWQLESTALLPQFADKRRRIRRMQEAK